MTPKKCRHRKVTLFGSEETGLRKAECGSCGTEMTRRAVGGEYVYFPIDEAPSIEQPFFAVLARDR